MEKQLARLLEKIMEIDEKLNKNKKDTRDEFREQTTALTKSLTQSMASTIEEKLKPLVEENKILKNDVAIMKNKVQNLEREVRKNNLILHGVEENESNNAELLQLVLKVLNEVGKDCELDNFDKWEISEARRLGSKVDQKRRPILIKFTLAWRKIEILKNNKRFPANIYVSEDYPKEVLQKRKEL